MADKLSEEQVARFKQVFECFDKDKGGSIDKDELGAAMYSLGATPTQVELQDMIDEVDHDGSGTIDFSEFLEMMAKKLDDLDTEEDLVEALELFDPLKEGRVAQAVLQHAMLNIGEKMTQEEVDFIFARLPDSAKENNRVDIAQLASFLANPPGGDTA